MDLTGYKHVILYGGSFDPPHLGHIRLPRLAMRAIGADLVAYIPTGRQPFKTHLTQAPAHHRLAMLRLALADVVENNPGKNPGKYPENNPEVEAVILTDEMDRAAANNDDKPSYIVDTLEIVCRRFDPGTKFRWLMGGDHIRTFHLWHQPERLIELAEPLVMIRPPDTRQTLLDSLPQKYDPQTWDTRLIKLPRMDVSSTQIRRMISQNISVKEFVGESAEHYIHKNRLYRA